MNRLKELRQKNGLTQQELADVAKVTKRSYIYWENNERQLKPEKAQILADFLEVPVSYLLGYSESISEDSYLAIEPDLLRKLRYKSGLSLQELSEVINIPEKTLEALENGERGFSQIHLRMLTSFFNVKVSEILGYTPTGGYSIPINITSPYYECIEKIEDIEIIDSLILDTVMISKLLGNIKSKLINNEIIKDNKFDRDIESVQKWSNDFNNALSFKKLELMTEENKNNRSYDNSSQI